MEDKNLEKIDLDDIQPLDTEEAESLPLKMESLLSKNKIAIELKSGNSKSEKELSPNFPEKNKINLSLESEKDIDLNKTKEEENDKVLAPEKKAIEVAGLSAQSSTTAIQKRREEAIDKILADGLGDIFLKMSPAKQKEFQIKGEETVKKISLLLNEARVSVSKIVELIKKWLKLIPGVNKFFLEQETKLKVDKIIKMKNNF